MGNSENRPTGEIKLKGYVQAGGFPSVTKHVLLSTFDRVDATRLFDRSGLSANAMHNRQRIKAVLASHLSLVTSIAF